VNKRSLPQPPSSGLDSIAEVAAGMKHVALRTRSGQVVLWADPEFVSNSSGEAMLALLFDPAVNVTSIASGSHTVIALTDRGEVLCTATDIEGLCSPLGTNSDPRTTLAGSAGGNQTVRAIRAGPSDVFFVQLNDVNGTWVLYNSNAQWDLAWLQRPPRPGTATTPDVSKSGRDWEVADLLVFHNESPSYWGYNVLLATYKDSGRPITINVSGNLETPGWTSVESISSVCIVTEYQHVAVLLSNGSVAVWAKGGSSDKLLPPSELGIDEQSRATSLACGASHISVTLVNGLSRAWGENAREGFLEPLSRVPVALVATAAGEFHNAYLSQDGNVYMTGTMETTAPRPLPDALITPTGLATQIAAGGECAVALLQGEGGVVAWGSAASGVADVPDELGGNPVVQVAAGKHHALALRADHSVVHWGAAAVNDTTPTGRMAAIVAGSNFVAAVDENDSRLLVWGDFQCDMYGWSLNNKRPAVVTGVTQVTAGYHSLAVLLRDGSVLASGCDAQHLPSLDQYTGRVAAVAFSGDGVLLLLLNSGHVVALDGYLQGKAVSNIPEHIQGQVEKISAGYDHALALLRDKSLVTWGYNGDDAVVSDIPPEVKAGRVMAISAGTTFSLAIVDPASLDSAVAVPPPGECAASSVTIDMH
jgi:alpha-tubulin suppressor-like RCC1 family protein